MFHTLANHQSLAPNLADRRLITLVSLFGAEEDEKTCKFSHQFRLLEAQNLFLMPSGEEDINELAHVLEARRKK